MKGEDKSGLPLQVHLKGGVMRLNFRGLSWETLLLVFFFLFNFVCLNKGNGDNFRHKGKERILGSHKGAQLLGA